MRGGRDSGRVRRRGRLRNRRAVCDWRMGLWQVPRSVVLPVWIAVVAVLAEVSGGEAGSVA